MALTCEARHAFAYTGRLTGGETLHSRAIARGLSNGRAWGAAVAAWHAFSGDEDPSGLWTPTLAKLAAHEALRASYDADIEEQRESGVIITPDQIIEQKTGEILDHHMAIARKFPNLTRLEGELDVPIPSRTGVRPSSLYRFQGFLDGFTVEPSGKRVVEFKLRDSLTNPNLIFNDRQIRRYCWAYQQETGDEVTGAYMEERLNKAPKPARLVQAKRKSEGIDGLTPSHQKDQLCTAQSYIDLCVLYDVEPRPETVQALESRAWHQLVGPIDFLQSELDEAGRELVSAAKTIRDLDSGERYPVRNTQMQLCRNCKFLEACPNPHDRPYLLQFFEYRVPKRLRPPKDESQPLPRTDNPFELAAARM